MSDQYPQRIKVKVDAVPEELIAEALIQSKGLQYIAARTLKVDAATICRRIADSPYLQGVVHEAKEHRIDLAELALNKHVEDNSLGGVCFTLKTVGKKRGYTEAPELLEATKEVVRQGNDLLEELKQLRQERNNSSTSNSTE